MTLGIRGHSPNAKTTYTLEKKLVIVEQLHWRCGNPRTTPVYPALGGDGLGSRSEVAFGSLHGTRIRGRGFLALQNRRHCASLLSAFIPLR